MVSGWKYRPLPSRADPGPGGAPSPAETNQLLPAIHALSARNYFLEGSPEQRRWAPALRIAGGYGLVAHGGAAGSIIRLTPLGESWLAGQSAA